RHDRLAHQRIAECDEDHEGCGRQQHPRGKPRSEWCFSDLERCPHGCGPSCRTCHEGCTSGGYLLSEALTWASKSAATVATSSPLAMRVKNSLSWVPPKTTPHSGLFGVSFEF